MRGLLPAAGEQLTGILEAGASQRCYLPEYFSGSAVPPWSLNREFFCLRAFSLSDFLQRNAQDPFLPCHFFTAVLAARAGTGGRRMPEGES